MDLRVLGWSEFFQLKDGQEQHIARVNSVYRSHYEAWDERGALNVYLPGKFQYGVTSASEYPVVGDWVVLSPDFVDEQGHRAALANKVLPRRSVISRIGSGTTSAEQVIAANIDFAFIVTSANRDLNIKRLQRYVVLTKNGGVTPVILLSKVDLCSNYQELVEEVAQTFPTAAVLGISGTKNLGLDRVTSYFQTGITGVFIGSSGVGKSTLVNCLLGRTVQMTKEIREDDDRGRHTTTSREMFALPDGGLVIDTPGLREVEIFGEEEVVASLFPKIESIILNCRFSNCQHEEEPGCAIRRSIETGEVTEADFESYQKLLREVAYSNRKMSKKMVSNEKKKWKAITVNMRQRRRFEGRE